VQLVVEQGSRAGQSIPLGGTIVVGRSEGSDLQLSEKGISRQHARFQSGPQGWSVVDLGSTNGTFVNGQRLLPDQPHLLRVGDRITIGSMVVVVQTDESGPSVSQEMMEGREPGGRPQPVLLAVGAAAFVVVLVGLVILLVLLLRPEAEPATPTVAGPLDQIVTAFPVPTGFQEAMTSVAPMLPTGFPSLPLGPSPTSTPEAGLPRQKMAEVLAPSVTHVPPPVPLSQFEKRDGDP
jgi:hypothetical protein